MPTDSHTLQQDLKNGLATDLVEVTVETKVGMKTFIPPPCGFLTPVSLQECTCSQIVIHIDIRNNPFCPTMKAGQQNLVKLGELDPSIIAAKNDDALSNFI